jgi:hypothetical protein
MAFGVLADNWTDGWWVRGFWRVPAAGKSSPEADERLQVIWRELLCIQLFLRGRSLFMLEFHITAYGCYQ